MFHRDANAYLRTSMINPVHQTPTARLFLIYREYGAYMSLTDRRRDKMAVILRNIFQCFFLNENVWISLNISLKFIIKFRINNNPALVQKMASRRPGHNPLSDSVPVSLPTHICVTRSKWVKKILIFVWSSVYVNNNAIQAIWYHKEL